MQTYAQAMPSTLPAVAPQQPATVTTVQRALRDGMSTAALLAVSDWNERKGYDERRRNSRKRLKNQAVALRAVAGARAVAAWMEAA